MPDLTRLVDPAGRHVGLLPHFQRENARKSHLSRNLFLTKKKENLLLVGGEELLLVRDP